MTPQKPDRRRLGGLPFALNLRVSTAQYRHLVLEAERDEVSIAEAVRRLIEGAIEQRDERSRAAIERGDSEANITYRALLAIADEDAFFKLADQLPTDPA